MQRQQRERYHQQDQEYSVQSSSSDHSDHELTVPTHSTHCGTSRQKRQSLSDIKNTQSLSRDRTPFDYPSDETDTERKRRTQQRKKDMKTVTHPTKVSQ